MKGSEPGKPPQLDCDCCHGGRTERSTNFERKVALASAIFAALSAIAAFNALYISKLQVEAAYSTAKMQIDAANQAANLQVYAALEVVNRTERFKIMSEFTDAAFKVCTEITPPNVANYVSWSSGSEKTDIVGSPLIYRIDIFDKKIESKFEDLLWRKKGSKLKEAEENLSVKARALSIWLPDTEASRTLVDWSNMLWQMSDPYGSVETFGSARDLVQARSNCEAIVRLKLKDLIR